MENEAEMTVMAGGRKRRGGGDESESSTLSFHAKTRRLGAGDSVSSEASSENSACESADPDRVLASCCSSNGAIGLVEESSDFVDLEENSEVIGEMFFTTSAVDAVNFGDERSEENASSGEVVSESCKLVWQCESKSTPPQVQMPTADELEEFFAAAEKELQVQFIDKYNYDIVNDKPLEGRFEWVQILP